MVPNGLSWLKIKTYSFKRLNRHFAVIIHECSLHDNVYIFLVDHL